MINIIFNLGSVKMSIKKEMWIDNRESAGCKSPC